MPWPSDAQGPSRCYALVPAAGSGSRAGLSTPKQYHVIARRRVIDHTLAALTAVMDLVGIGVVLAPLDNTPVSQDVRVRTWRVGGATRAESVLNGLVALAQAGARDHDWVLVHDAARCLVQPADIQALIDACRDDPVGGLLAVPLADTLKEEGPDGGVERTLPREGKWLAQTPQMFRLGALRDALLAHRDTGFSGITDEASALERRGARPRLVRGSSHNFKLTYPEDFVVAQALLTEAEAPAWRIGEGWDVHALVPGRRLVLGGVEIPFDRGLLGHSDADALLHAITDALLGAAGLGDIGAWFPDTDERLRGADSVQLLAEAHAAVRERGWQLVNVDATVIAQAPRLGPYRAAMQAQIAACLDLPPQAVNVKAKTAERLGPAGQGLCIEARAVALLQRAPRA
ncbi:MAG: 2-C-methyl-D-erythritol 4-phosphate cytidylyltransferase [Tepidimonas sp.]|uniref:2-C-methyl-D-erythritol 4-phosphate cytidylyltransferase n=1 Tax=Tepidimonas sp. TaxID=2002775 RepID=UPI00259ED7CB|nr:2-C-methyl-D-erythritol 4-phosphate cytidylyltransferase [Tepidimonas sp.]MDM7457308.1 2-C-methyl-D-erythritol 4-phosphate cytidylyltransferase [Tepidimonas sp.]